MKTIFDESYSLLEIERSKFHALAFHVESENEFKEKLVQVKKKYPKATHYCYAYILENKQKSNDDGEPSGTAGLPILETIKNQNLSNVGVVVVRYFGGIKLGAGGLTRAYIKACSEALKQANIKDVSSKPLYNIEFSHSLINVVEKFINQNNLKVIKKEYFEIVNYQLILDSEELLTSLVNICLGKISIDSLGSIVVVE